MLEATVMVIGLYKTPAECSAELLIRKRRRSRPRSTRPVNGYALERH